MGLFDIFFTFPCVLALLRKSLEKELSVCWQEISHMCGLLQNYLEVVSEPSGPSPRILLHSGVLACSSLPTCLFSSNSFLYISCPPHLPLVLGPLHRYRASNLCVLTEEKSCGRLSAGPGGSRRATEKCNW